jgi:hypothetical protein
LPTLAPGQYLALNNEKVSLTGSHRQTVIST